MAAGAQLAGDRIDRVHGNAVVSAVGHVSEAPDRSRQNRQHRRIAVNQRADTIASHRTELPPVVGLRRIDDLEDRAGCARDVAEIDAAVGAQLPLVSRRGRAAGCDCEGGALAFGDGDTRGLGGEAGRDRCRGDSQRSEVAGDIAGGICRHHAVLLAAVAHHGCRRGVAGTGGIDDVVPACTADVELPLECGRGRAAGSCGEGGGGGCGHGLIGRLLGDGGCHGGGANRQQCCRAGDAAQAVANHHAQQMPVVRHAHGRQSQCRCRSAGFIGVSGAAIHAVLPLVGQCRASCRHGKGRVLPGGDGLRGGLHGDGWCNHCGCYGQGRC